MNKATSSNRDFQEDIKELYNFYIKHLKERILPFWLNNSPDYSFGGFYTCFDNYGRRLLSTDKYTWSQGRMLWVLCKLYSSSIFTEEEKKEFFVLAARGAEFLMDNCLLEDGSCSFILSAEGEPKKQRAEDDFSYSIYADCFVVLGLSAYLGITGDTRSYSFLKKLYPSIVKRIEENSFKSEPYPVPKGYKSLGIPMILLNISYEYASALKKINKELYEEVNDVGNRAMEEIMEEFLQEDGLIREMIKTDRAYLENLPLESSLWKGEDSNNLLTDYVNPGHSLEDMWFVILQAKRSKREDIVRKAVEVIERTLDIGWDKEYDGLLLFSSAKGGRPQGSLQGIELEAMTEKVLKDWDSKLWWVHSEALYASLLAYSYENKEEQWHNFKKLHHYTFRTFPSADEEPREWIQIRDRKGAPEEKLVALPVKDPFHIMRNIILIIELLEKINKGK